MSSTRHPWDKWFCKGVAAGPRPWSKRKLILKRGRDFTCQPHSMAVQIRAEAARRRLGVSVLIDEGVLTVTVKR